MDGSCTKLKDIVSGFLMLGDTDVMYFNFKDYCVHILNPNLVPYSLADINNVISSNPMSHMDVLSMFREWLSNRIISMSIGNYKQLVAYFNLLQTSDMRYRSKVALNCRAISMEDAYWIKYENEHIDWKDVCPYNNHLRDIVTVSLSTTIPSITGDIEHPNLTMSGTFPKTWLRMDDGIYLIKAGKTLDDINAIVEIMSSDFLSCIKSKNFDFVRYEQRDILIDDNNRKCSICKSYYKEGTSVVKGDDIIMYSGKEDLLSLIHSNGYILTYISNMIVVDYLLVNTDRHPSNYAFYMNNINGNIESCVPLYDFNYSFIADLIGKNIDDTLCQTFNDGKNIISVVNEYVKYSDIVIDKMLLNSFLMKYCMYPNISEGINNRIQYLEKASNRSILV